MRRVLAFLLAIILSAPAWAASSSSPATAPLYEVQVLVFANHLPNLDGGENWQQDPNPPIKGLKQALEPSQGLPQGSPLLIAERRLAHHASYTILAARSWVQNAVPLRKTKNILIQSSKHGHLNGVIRVFQWHLLHVELNLRYHHNALNGNSALTGNSANTGNGAFAGNGTYGANMGNGAVTDNGANEENSANAPIFRLIQNRPMIPGRINYFDNPKFGVLVLITRYKGPALSQPSAATATRQKTTATPQPSSTATAVPATPISR